MEVETNGGETYKVEVRKGKYFPSPETPSYMNFCRGSLGFLCGIKEIRCEIKLGKGIKSSKQKVE